MAQSDHVYQPACYLLLAGFVIGLLISSPNPAAGAQAPVNTLTPTSTPSSTNTPLPTVTFTPLPSLTVSPTSTTTPTATCTSTSTATSTSTSMATSTSTSTATGSPTPLSSATGTPTPTSSQTAAAPPTVYPPQAILINEIAWSGTLASAYDEWIELNNTLPVAIDLTGWTLTDGSDINIPLSGTVPPHGLFLLERTDDTTVSNIPADQIYAGGLRNSGENLRLLDPGGNLVDSANYPGGWPAGDAATRISMERQGGEDIPGNWGDYSGSGGWGMDAASNPIQGTPRQTNSFFLPTATPTATPTDGSPSDPTTLPPQSILINEIAWAGTNASYSDEWIELHNPGAEPIDISGWLLSDGGDINIILSGEIGPFGYILLERTDDNCVIDVAAHQIYSGNLNNSGERLLLQDSLGSLIDSANADGGGWPSGASGTRRSMERRGGADTSSNWGTFTGYHGSGHDADGGGISGTPGTTNSLFYPTPIPTWIPGKVVINEVLIRPHYDWEDKEGASLDDEFIELYNIGPHGVDLGGFILDDIADGGSRPFTLPNVRLPPGGFIAFFRSLTRIALNDTGDEVRLLAPNGRTLDRINYLKVRAYNLSYGRLPDGSGHLHYGLWPTPGEANILFVESTEDSLMDTSPVPGYSYRMRLPRLSRFPAMVYRMHALGHVFQIPRETEDSP